MFRNALRQSSRSVGAVSAGGRVTVVSSMEAIFSRGIQFGLWSFISSS